MIRARVEAFLEDWGFMLGCPIKQHLARVAELAPLASVRLNLGETY
jgi:hypothetical protein